MSRSRFKSKFESKFKPRLKYRLPSKFPVVVSDYTSSVEEWKRAMSAPKSELPELSAEQKDFAKRFGVSEEDYRRGLAAGQYGNERMRNKGLRLGEQVEQVLENLGKNYRLAAVLWEGSRLRWLLRVETPERVVGIPISFELADDVVDSGILQEIEKLKQIVISGVGQGKSSSR